MTLHLPASTPVPRSLLEVPGMQNKWKRTPPPRNCAALLGLPGTDPAVEVDLPEEIRPWVWDWLVEYQQRALAWAQPRRAFHLWWACGAGKTPVSTFAALQTGGPVIVVCRAFAKAQWRREVEKVSFVQPLVLDGKTGRQLPLSERMVILGWECLAGWRECLEDWIAHRKGTVIFDEIHKAKHWRRRTRYVKEDGTFGYEDLANISASASKLGQAAHRRIGLTATPAANDLSDLWSQLDVIETDCWGTSWDFGVRYCNGTVNLYGGLDTRGVSNREELGLRLREVVHVVKQGELNKHLPPKRRQLVYLRKEDQNRPTAWAADLKKAARRGGQSLFEAKLMEAASRKRKWAGGMLEEALDNGHKVFISTGRRLDCERLFETVKKQVKDRCPVWWAHGETADRDEKVRAYMEADSAVLVGTYQAFGESLNLQDTDLVLIVMLQWTPKDVLQFEGRFARQGQKRPVLVVYAIAEGTIDEHVADLVLEKMTVVGEGLEGLGGEEASEVGTMLSGEANDEEILAAMLERMSA